MDNVMSYLPTWIVVVVGLVLLVVVLTKAVRAVRLFGASAGAVGARFNDQTGTLRARSAALRVAIKQTRTRVKRAPTEVRSQTPGETGGRRG